MASGKEIRTQITTIKKTQKITRAMEMVAASKMRRAQERMETSRPYAREIYRVIGHLARSHSEYHHPYLLHREVKRVGYIIITTDRGLCGGLNSNLFRTLIRDLANWHAKDIPQDICVVGTKGEHFFKRHGGQIVAVTTHLGDAPEQSTLNGFVKIMLDEYREGKIDALYLCYNEFVTTMSQKPTVKPLLPLPFGEEVKQDHWDYIYEPDSKVLLDKLFDRYIEQQVYQAVVENNASEQAARMVAMKSASENAGELIDELQLAYNKARQAAITKELAEIVGGAAAV